jgi:hypothetical protein
MLARGDAESQYSHARSNVTDRGHIPGLL